MYDYGARKGNSQSAHSAAVGLQTQVLSSLVLSHLHNGPNYTPIIQGMLMNGGGSVSRRKQIWPKRKRSKSELVGKDIFFSF